MANLYLISQDKNNGCGTYDSAVVCCEDEDTARNMDPSTGQLFTEMIREDQEDVMLDWCAPEYVTIKFIGVAAPDVAIGVVCDSFTPHV